MTTMIGMEFELSQLFFKNREDTRSRWFKMIFVTGWKSLNPLKGVTDHHRQKVKKNRQDVDPQTLFDIGS